jgi:hypothetical protein
MLLRVTWERQKRAAQSYRGDDAKTPGTQTINHTMNNSPGTEQADWGDRIEFQSLDDALRPKVRIAKTVKHS